MKKNPLISVIIPVYNAESYLKQCLDSIISQTYSNLEIICIDDGSLDRSRNILNAYKKLDRRFVVIYETNKGVSEARNVGLEQIHGEYVMFVDADDWIDIDTCEKAVTAIVSADADVVMWSYVSEHRTTRFSKNIFPSDFVFERQEVLNKLHRRCIGIVNEEFRRPEQADSLSSVWGKLYKSQLIRQSGVRFIDLNKIGTYEDGLFNLEIFFYVNRAVYINQCLYHYRRQQHSSVTSRYREKLAEQWGNMFCIMNEYIIRNNLSEKYKIALNNRIVLSIFGLGLNILNSEFNNWQKYKMIKCLLKNKHYKNASKDFKIQYFPLPWKVFYFLAIHNFSLGVFSLLIVIRKIIDG